MPELWINEFPRGELAVFTDYPYFVSAALDVGICFKFHHLSDMGSRYGHVQFDPEKDTQKYMATCKTILL